MVLRGNFLSETLRLGTNIQIYIPHDKSGPYRVIYLLHGLHGDQGTWLDQTMIPVFARKYNAIMVIPEASRSFYLNLKYGRKYFDFVSDELPRLTRGILNISEKREDTAVMGCSMGAYGALKVALSRPDRFGFCGAISPACLYFNDILNSLRDNVSSYRETGAEAEETLIDLYCAFGEGLECKKEYDIIELARSFPNNAPKPKIYVTCGTEDKLRDENLRFRDEIKSTGLDYSYEEWAGGHDWYFFNDALKKTLEIWYGEN